MYSRNGLDQFQKDMTTGRFTFPVVVLLCLGMWMLSLQSWYEIISLGICALTSFFMIETNTAFTLIRTRTNFHISLYWFAVGACTFLHPYQTSYWLAPIFMLSLFRLFESYELPNSTSCIYQSFLFLGIGSLVNPLMIVLAVPFYIGMIIFRSFTLKTCFAALLGLLTPYWIEFGICFFIDEIHLLTDPYQHFKDLSPFNFQNQTIKTSISIGILLLLSFASSIHYLIVSYKDKTRTRMFLFFFIQLEVWLIVCGILYPQSIDPFFQLQLILCAFLTGHLFTLTQNRFVNILFLITFVVLFLLMLYNLWM